MTSKNEAMREGLDALGWDAPAADVVRYVWDTYGIEVKDGSVRAVKSRAKSSAGDSVRRPAVRRPGARARHTPIRTGRQKEPGYIPDTEDGYDTDDSEDESDESAYQAPAPEPKLETRASFTPMGIFEQVAERERLADEDFQRWYDDAFMAIETAWHTGKPQSTTGDPVTMGMVRDICNDPEVRAGTKTMPYNVDLRHNPDGSCTVIITPLKAASYVPAKLPRRKTAASCEFCREKTISGNMYLVSNMALPREMILCAMHAQAEATVPGALIRPYRVESDAGTFGVVRQTASVYEQFRSYQASLTPNAGRGYVITMNPDSVALDAGETR